MARREVEAAGIEKDALIAATWADEAKWPGAMGALWHIPADAQWQRAWVGEHSAPFAERCTAGGRVARGRRVRRLASDSPSALRPL